MRYTITTLALTGALATGAPVFAGQYTFTLLDTAGAQDVTVDQFGRTLVLTHEQGYITSTYIYDSGSYGYIGDAVAYHMSEEGTAAAGSVFNIDGVQEAARWTQSGGWETLGALPNALTCPSISSGYGISGDGSTVVGLSWDGCNARSFYWNETEGMVEMAYLGNGNARASNVSKDGTTFVGFTQGNFSRTPAVWVTGGGAHPTYPFDPDAVGELWAVTPDGGTVAGQSSGVGDSGTPAFYWNEAEGAVPIGWLDDDGIAQAKDISDDGNTIVGYSGTVFTGFDAFIWTRQRGMEKLSDRLADIGVNIPENVILQQAQGVTGDGLTIVGYAFVLDPEGGGANKAFIVQLPEPVPCPEDLDGDGAVGFTDLTQLLGTWGPCLGCPEDLDGDDAVGFTDLTQLLGSWGPCN